ncbi:hypothetical protein M407DRAFT_24918 [Tulasnella calospora MUT 4182]|uniref:Zn(2)-C6 fungal-type domain-containing protein n=1 Tax=Tulasnella calospora MUT 4182 TaxID=1051891 RepID=A0A0C3QH32_9AGAM|nr:hypothetical protein M407DRAFT_24918 [Tulasnella calospora MUT 4182]
MPATRTVDAASTTGSRSKRTVSSSIAPGASPRKQNTACAACRRRRVRCDRRDGNVDICTECAQRGFACVDDERQMGKILRRGRKIQELEALFGQYPPGKRPNPDEVRQRLAAAGSRTVSGSSTQSSRPMKRELTMEFFSSDYFKWFQMHFPILDPAEFIDRYEKFVNRGISLGAGGELIAQTLRAWATSYGFDENGADALYFQEEGVKVEDDDALATAEKRKAATNAIVRDILDAVDKNAVARTTTWDGVRVLLLLLPLTEDVLSPGDRVNLYRSTLNQVYSLSGLDSGNEKFPELDGPVKEIVRARIVWHAIVDEGITSALNGNKLIFDQDDAISFEPTLTSETYNAALQSCPVTAHLNSNFTFIPCRLAAVCRLINEYLTSPKAERLAACGKEDITQQRLELIWSTLEESLKEFDSLRGTGDFADSVEDELRETFVSKWQIIIYGIYNTIRERLWARISHLSDSIGSRSSARMRSMINLHDMAESRCNALVARTLDAIRRHAESWFFELDAGLFEPGIVFAAEHFANDADCLEEFQCCTDALQRMRWAFSQNENQVTRLNALWDARRAEEAMRTHIPQQQLPAAPLLAPFDNSMDGDSGFTLDNFRLVGGSSLGNDGLAYLQLHPANNSANHQGDRYWQTTSLPHSPLNVSIDGASEGTRKSSSAFSGFEIGGSPVSPTHSVSQGSAWSDSQIEEGVRSDARHQFMGRFQPNEDFLPITPAIPGLSLPSPTFHSPSSDIVRTPATYGPPIINSGRMESPLHPHIVAPLGQLSGHGAYLDSVVPLTQHSLPEAREMRSTHSSVSSSSVYLQPSLEAPLPLCDQSLDVLQFLGATSLNSYPSSAFSL